MENNKSKVTTDTDVAKIVETIFQERQKIYELDADHLLKKILEFFRKNPYNNCLYVGKDGDKFVVGVDKTIYYYNDQTLKQLRKRIEGLDGFLWSEESPGSLYVRIKHD